MSKISLFSAIGADAVKSATESDPYDKPTIYVVEIYLKDVLKRRGIKQKELAQMTGLRPNAITNLCRGYNERVSLDHIGRIATALGITDISEIMRLVEYEEADFFNMYNSIHRDDPEE
ncbi:helix-turn-helix transcriptional regulator [Brevibacillus composti]|uniref:Helix-turn-helix transcriptional regulator n=1 Tax=Brevibacillus composti TaxID=2796470 RepID=A0A7T5EIG9_9BACL|nr:helix-turn-helix transcriptional regulator [Brevibacillus composti]QQE73163.1 helix-turn-helix transcriptional regulator [Brevibacillus composti]QUO40241.1 helix-turn-helix transcriptional regulator [Brevibacillus composti]